MHRMSVPAFFLSSLKLAYFRLLVRSRSLAPSAANAWSIWAGSAFGNVLEYRLGRGKKVCVPQGKGPRTTGASGLVYTRTLGMLLLLPPLPRSSHV